jgi:tetratricopeptide (TPR) repeat protein
MRTMGRHGRNVGVVLLLILGCCVVAVGIGILSEYLHSPPEYTAPAGTYVAAAVKKVKEVEDFRRLAAEMKTTHRTVELRKLVLEHAKNSPDDPLLPLYQAEVYLQQGRYALADRTFTQALDKGPDARTLESFRDSRVLARYRTGQALAAYRDIEPRQETFQLLASLAYEDHDNDLLQGLLDAHARNDPEDRELPYDRCRLALSRNQVADAIGLFKTVPAWDVEHFGALLDDFAANGLALEAYRAAASREKAFAELADLLAKGRRTDELRQLVAEHARSRPDDPVLAAHRGELLLAEKAWDQAARVFEEALKIPPPENEERLLKGYLTASYHAGRALQCYEKLGPPRTIFSILAELMAHDRKGEELLALTMAHERRVPGDSDSLYYQAVARLILKQPDEATALFRKVYAEENDAERFKQLYEFMSVAHEVGLGMEAYRESPNPSLAFDGLATLLTSQKKDRELAALIVEHGQRMASDPEYAFYQGELYVLRGEFDHAAQHFTAALARAHPVAQKRYRGGLFRARIKAGEVVRAYRDAQAAPADTFAQLAQLCAAEKTSGQLRALITAHRKAEPEDPDLPGWELEACLLDRDYEGALKLLTEHRDDVFTLPAWRSKTGAYRIRCLVKLKRHAEAVREADRLKRTNPVLLLLAYAAAGDVRQSIALIESAKNHAHLASCYSDADLGPILRSDAFRAFREKFPEPRPNAGKMPGAAAP